MFRRRFLQITRNISLAGLSLAGLSLVGLSLAGMSLVGVAGPSVSAFAADAADADNADNAAAHVDTMIVDMAKLLEIDNGDMAARRAAVTELLDKYFDFPGIARFSAGQYWRSATAAEKSEFEYIIHEVIIGTVVNNFDQLKGLEYTPLTSTAKGKKLVVVSGQFSDVTGVRPSVMVNWRVTTAPDMPVRVLDIEIENISMLITQKQENIAIIRKNKGKFSALIDAMKAKLEN